MLIAPLTWALLVWGALTATMLITDAADPTYAYLAATSTLLPAMAILGAKRPQHVGWQWIVLALWATLVWPRSRRCGSNDRCKSPRSRCGHGFWSCCCSRNGRTGA
ncbi:MAG: hypothetical protein QM811_30535 [Pirellulales bacterium]